MIVVPLFFFGRTALAALPGKTPGLCGECLEKTELRGGVSGIDINSTVQTEAKFWRNETAT